MATASTSSRRAIAATSFDLLNGSYKKAATFRLVALLLVGAVLVGVIGILALWVNRGFEVRTLEEQLSVSKVVAEKTEGELTQLSNSGGLNEDVMTQHLSARSELALSIAAATPSVAALTQGLAQVAPAGTTVTKVDLGTEATATAAPSTDSAPASKPVPEPVAVTITATVLDYSAVEPWINALTGVEGLEDMRTKWANGSEGTSLVVTTTAKLSPPSANDPDSQRCVLERQLGVKLNAPEPCPVAAVDPSALPNVLGVN